MARVPGSPYARAMRSELGAAIDGWLAELMIIRLRRAWPLLKLVPASWIFPIVAPSARRLRRSLCHGAVAVAVSAGAVIVLIALRSSGKRGHTQGTSSGGKATSLSSNSTAVAHFGDSD